MTLVANAGCGLEPKERTADGMNQIKKTKKELNQESLLERENGCVNVYVWCASQIRMLSELICNA